MGNKRGKTYEAPDMAAFVGRTMRAMTRRAAEGDREVLSALASIRADLDRAEAEAVAGLRARGNSWTDVARELGITRQAAQQKWGRVPATAQAAKHTAPLFDVEDIPTHPRIEALR